MKLKDKHWGSTIGVITGILIFLSPLGNLELTNSHIYSTGVLVILGSLSYRFRKKQILSNSKRWPIIEIITAMLLLLHISLGLNNKLWYEHPLNFVFVPIWILIAYFSLYFVKK